MSTKKKIAAALIALTAVVGIAAVPACAAQPAGCYEDD